MKELFYGYCPALVTPITKKRIDLESFKELIDFQIRNGASAIVVLGTTGEASTLTHKEKIAIVKIAVEYVNKRVPVIVGAGSNDTKIAVRYSKLYEKMGADALLIVTPYYNKTTQNGLVEHYKKIASCVKIPIILYNVPSRTGVNILPETVLKLSSCSNIIGIKEASGNIEQVMELFRICGNKISIYSGDDSLTYLFLCLGGSGVISVLGNVAPNIMFEICDNFKKDINISRELQLKVMPLMKAMFYEVNPIPIKTAMKLVGFRVGNVRLPLVKMSKDNLSKLKKQLKIFNLL